MGFHACIVLSFPKPVCAWVFDPALCEEEVLVVQELGCSVIPKNEVKCNPLTPLADIQCQNIGK